jgi:predicted RNase H-like nuclease (RuvC/YqgF family)
MKAAIITLVLLVGYFIYKALNNEREDNAHRISMREEYEKELEAFHGKNVYLQTKIDNLNEDIKNYKQQISDLEGEVRRLKKYEEREESRAHSSDEITAYNEGYEDGYQSGLGESEKEAYKIGFMHGHQHGMEDEHKGKNALDYWQSMDRAEKSMKKHNLNYK